MNVVNENIMFLKLLAITTLSLAFLVGCVESPWLQNHDGTHQAKQIHTNNFESNYIICRRCVEHTRLDTSLKNNYEVNENGDKN
jgi:hypothetical protein